jgi:uncharacterized protein involved in propanediol utilization
MTKSTNATLTLSPHDQFDREADEYSILLEPIRQKTGPGQAIAHNGEILQGVFEEQGELHRGLVTLPCELFSSKAFFIPDITCEEVVIYPPWKVTKKAKRAAELAIRECLERKCGGLLILEDNIPERWGMGSSTSNVVATIRAVANPFGITLRPSVIAELSVEAEQASDSIMYGNHAVLFAHREGIVLENFSGSLPHLFVLGFNTDPTGQGVDTLAFPPAQYNWREIEQFRYLRGLMRRAVKTQSQFLVGKVASASARINQWYLPKPHFDRLEKLVERVQAVGIQVAHSGTIAGLLFDPNSATRKEQMDDARILLEEIGIQDMWEFEVSNNRKEVLS